MKIGNTEVIKTTRLFNKQGCYFGYVTYDGDDCFTIQFLDNEHGLAVESLILTIEKRYILPDYFAESEIQEFFNTRPVGRLSLITGMLID